MEPFHVQAKNNCSQTYVFKMLTLPKNTAVTLDRSAKGHVTLLNQQFTLSAVTYSSEERALQSYRKDSLATVLQVC